MGSHNGEFYHVVYCPAALSISGPIWKNHNLLVEMVLIEVIQVLEKGVPAKGGG